MNIEQERITRDLELPITPESGDAEPERRPMTLGIWRWGVKATVRCFSGAGHALFSHGTVSLLNRLTLVNTMGKGNFFHFYGIQTFFLKKKIYIFP